MSEAGDPPVTLQEQIEAQYKIKMPSSDPIWILMTLFERLAAKFEANAAKTASARPTLDRGEIRRVADDLVLRLDQRWTVQALWIKRGVLAMCGLGVLAVAGGGFGAGYWARGNGPPAVTNCEVTRVQAGKAYTCVVWVEVPVMPKTTSASNK